MRLDRSSASHGFTLRQRKEKSDTEIGVKILRFVLRRETELSIVVFLSELLMRFMHRRLCRVKNMLAMYLKYHKAELTPTTPVTSIAISPVKMSIGRKSLTNLRSEMIFLQGKPVFVYLPTIYTPILTDNPQILLTMDT